MSDKPEKIYAYPGSLIYALVPRKHTVEYIRADLAKPSEEVKRLEQIIDEQRSTLEGSKKYFEGEIEKLSQNICDECSPDDYGWKYNRVDGKHPCTCITESGAYQALQDRIKELEVDALKWRALLSSDRIRVLGSAGFPELGSDNKTWYRHFGIDFWNGCEGVVGERGHAVNILEWFVEAIAKARK